MDVYSDDNGTAYVSRWLKDGDGALALLDARELLFLAGLPRQMVFGT